MSIIIFGASGQVGSHIARLARSKSSNSSAEIILAQRNPAKPIPDLDASSFRSVQADLLDPRSVAEAVSATGATKAFVYLAFGGDMEASFVAMRDAGVRFVVFLSTTSILGEPGEVPESELIPYVHARVELQLQRVFGEAGFVSVRPGAFASNAFQFGFDGAKREVRVYRPELRFDYIAPVDIAVVCTNLLLRGSGGERVVFLSGPEMLSQRQAVEIIAAAVFGQEFNVVAISEEEGIKRMMATGAPQRVAEYSLKSNPEVVLSKTHGPGKESWVKYAGGKTATSFKEWVETEKSKFEKKAE